MSYLPINSWDQHNDEYIDLKDIDQFNISDSIIVESDVILPENDIYTFTMENENVVVSDLFLIISHQDYDFDNFNILGSRIRLQIDNCIVYEIDMDVNLVMAKIVGKKIKQYDNIIEIPIIFFDLEKSLIYNKYPLFNTTTQNIKIFLPLTNCSLSLKYKKYYIYEEKPQQSIFNPIIQIHKEICQYSDNNNIE